MKAILLAAGRGTRISKNIKEIPKCTLPVGDIPLIRRTVEMLLGLNIQPVVCVGFKREKVYEALEGLPVSFYYNPFFDVTNSIASLWFTRKELNDDLVIMNADVFLSQEFLKKIIQSEYDVVMAADRSRITIGDYFFTLNAEQCIKGYGKDLPVENRSCEYVGIAKIDKSFASVFNTRLEKLISSQQHGVWWENVLYSFTDSSEKNIHILDVGGLFWAEIDYFDDYERILNYVTSRKEQ